MFIRSSDILPHLSKQTFMLFLNKTYLLMTRKLFDSIDESSFNKKHRIPYITDASCNNSETTVERISTKWMNLHTYQLLLTIVNWMNESFHNSEISSFNCLSRFCSLLKNWNEDSCIHSFIRLSTVKILQRSSITNLIYCLVCRQKAIIDADETTVLYIRFT